MRPGGEPRASRSHLLGGIAAYFFGSVEEAAGRALFAVAFCLLDFAVAFGLLSPMPASSIATIDETKNTPSRGAPEPLRHAWTFRAGETPAFEAPAGALS